MKLGAVYFFTDDGPDPVEFAQAAEGYQFESLFLPEHTHFPVSRKTPYPAAYGGDELPSFYLHTLDQVVTLSAIAANTETLTLGTGICLLAQHDAISKAKQLATLDFLSSGRLVCGIGFGWNQEEAEAHGVVWKKRFSIIRDKVKVMQALWTQEEASYDGVEASLARSWSWPKPKQPRGPRIYLGGAGPTTMRHAAEWADAWYVVPPPHDPTLESSIPKFWEIVDEVGRDRDSISIAVASAPPDPAVLERYAAQGVERAALWVDPANSPSGGMANLEAVARVVAAFNG
ncbi:TIGR03619 family F420-dependent LLM class oxidoreductase [Saccharopolyspora erythraea]|uniref:TIGR03619 family F420-dependent LLM class oxidoreductase n=1 Tax=Saccharopolyspora erythraea TaxID=1836 RepID=UPI001BA7EF96|nr:TIGR03619 family F420-dependent LLM class oxidoreductase [Saccharopolyspora erythraea]QUH01823.1 TIGR03619 family F420-dependent LLM class oxidoreductase [Saccharopolyspora erythraea]